MSAYIYQFDTNSGLVLYSLYLQMVLIIFLHHFKNVCSYWHFDEGVKALGISVVFFNQLLSACTTVSWSKYFFHCFHIKCKIKRASQSSVSFWAPKSWSNFFFKLIFLGPVFFFFLKSYFFSSWLCLIGTQNVMFNTTKFDHLE